MPDGASAGAGPSRLDRKTSSSTSGAPRRRRGSSPPLAGSLRAFGGADAGAGAAEAFPGEGAVGVARSRAGVLSPASVRGNGCGAGADSRSALGATRAGGAASTGVWRCAGISTGGANCRSNCGGAIRSIGAACGTGGSRGLASTGGAGSLSTLAGATGTSRGRKSAGGGIWRSIFAGAIRSSGAGSDTGSRGGGATGGAITGGETIGAAALGTAIGLSTSVGALRSSFGSDSAGGGRVEIETSGADSRAGADGAIVLAGSGGAVLGAVMDGASRRTGGVESAGTAGEPSRRRSNAAPGSFVSAPGAIVNPLP